MTILSGSQSLVKMIYDGWSDSCWSLRQNPDPFLCWSLSKYGLGRLDHRVMCLALAKLLKYVV